MSRMFEALRRAELERKSTPVAEEDLFVDAAAFSESEEPAVVETGVVWENIARYPWRPSAESFPTLAERGAGVEQFRSLRSRVHQARHEAPIKTVLISSGLPFEGKSFVAANLAMSLARNTDSHILLIDGDLRRPTLHTLLGAPDGPGLSEFLEGKASLNEVLQRSQSPRKPNAGRVGGIANLAFIPSGQCGEDSSELVANHRFEELVARSAPLFDWILIDSPPVLAVTDAVGLSYAADAVLLIARGATTTYDVAQRTQAAFCNSRILGFVLNDVKNPPSAAYNYYDYNNSPSKASQIK